MELLFEYLTKDRGLDPKRVAETLWQDYQRGGRRDKPNFLREFLPEKTSLEPTRRVGSALPKRQARHFARKVETETQAPQLSHGADALDAI